MGRTLPTACVDCDGVLDWGDFGPSSGANDDAATCTCPPLDLPAWPTPPESRRPVVIGCGVHHRDLGYGRVVAVRFERDRTGIVALWGKHEGELFTSEGSLRWTEISWDPDGPSKQYDGSKK